MSMNCESGPAQEPVQDQGSSVSEDGKQLNYELKSVQSEGLNVADFDTSPVQPKKSKSALKREQRYERLKATFSSRRAQEKERRKLKKIAARKRLQAIATREKPYVSTRTERRLLNEKLTAALTNGIKLCVDMSFPDIMSPKEIGQLASQICFMYATNKKVQNPFCLHLMSLRKGTHLYDEVIKRCSGFEYYKIKVFEEPLEQIFSTSDLVYMSPDSPNVLEEIDPKKVYVIGGLVDGTPKKQVSLTRAQDIGCQTARLPITEYMTRVTPHGYNTILTLNQVYEILMIYNETKSWEAALKPCVPQRKGFKLSTEVGEKPTVSTPVILAQDACGSTSEIFQDSMQEKTVSEVAS